MSLGLCLPEPISQLEPIILGKKYLLHSSQNELWLIDKDRELDKEIPDLFQKLNNKDKLKMLLILDPDPLLKLNKISTLFLLR